LTTDRGLRNPWWAEERKNATLEKGEAGRTRQEREKMDPAIVAGETRIE
jgi:hypothetical protein